MMRAMTVQHIWFDFSETIAHINAEEHSKLKYKTYASVVGRPLDTTLKKQFDEQYEAHNHSISDIFYSLGKPPGWWSQQIAAIDPAKLFVLTEKDIPQIMQEIKKYIPVSIFSNINLGRVLPAIGIDPGLFAHILSAGMVSRPKPALDGFYRIIELSKLEPEKILYIGDHENKDIVPAKQVGLQAGIIWGESDKADYTFNSFRDVLELIEKSST
jgi:FMN phosphatase YigB (HAD superfamily)